MADLIEFKPAADAGPEDKPLFGEAEYSSAHKCTHDGATFQISRVYSRVTCSLCDEVVEAIVALKKMLDSEWVKARRENAAAWHRNYADQEAEKQATKTRKAAYATLYRFGVTPEMYAEEYRRKAQLGELELKQDYNKTLAFEAVSQ